MAEMTVARDTVSIDGSVHEIYRELTEGNHPVDAPFRIMKDVFMWAVSLGIQHGNPKPLSGKRVTIFRWAQFDQTDIPVLKAVALTKSKDVNVLLDQERMLSIAEEYANAGIHELRARLIGEYGQPLWNLVGAIGEVHDV